MKKYQEPTAKSIDIEASVLLSLIRNTSENYPAIFSGALFGFEDDNGSVDISHVCPYPYPDQYEGGSLKSRSGLKFQNEFADSLKSLGYGVEFQGWFQSTISGNYITNHLVESLIQQQFINKNSFILIHNMASIGKEVDLKAIRLTENFIKTYIDNKWKSKDLELNKLSFLNIFEEIPININNQYLIDLYLSENLPQLNQSKLNEFDNLNLLSNQNVTSKLLESLSIQVDNYNFDQNNFNYYQRQYSKENTKINQWKNNRKLENLERSKRGESELDVNEWQSLYKLPVEPSRYNNMLYSNAIDNLADDLLKKCDEELIKSFAVEGKVTE
ncbi:putative eukaryotic translation initiation factor 3 subunit H [[Candida] jaroonii]|uniref:Eukaryotic translation initiation factor 3 subunit H n=1 Tax=[Candida] jaroonii TaxID=467808 RepID=A0ACA9YG56_9ASCO|nr:putative eukaryotic translation initiation factor 3 subunit H [[Candida] jaroonii]